MKADAIKENIRKNKVNYAFWLGIITVVFFVYHQLSDGDFSFLMTFGAIIRSGGFIVLLLKIVTQQSCSGVSAKSLQLYALVFFFRFISIVQHEGYLPFDKSGDWFYQAVECLSFIVSITCMGLLYGPFSATHNAAQDSFGNAPPVPPALGALWLVLPTMLLAVLVHPKLNQVWWSDVSWTFALYTEATAILPQLYMFQKTGGVVEDFTSHFVYCLGFARFLELWFWLSSHHELNDKGSGGFVGYSVVAAQFIQMILMGDFFYFYIKSTFSKGPMTLPTHGIDSV